MIGAHQPGSQPIDIPEVIPNPAVVPKQEPAPKEPVRVPEKVPADRPRIDARQVETERHCRQRENALGDPAHRLTAAIALSGYRSPAAIPLGTAREICSSSDWFRETSTAATFSSRYARRLVPGIGTMSSPCASTHASAS
jgi:hypothetical protein